MRRILRLCQKTYTFTMENKEGVNQSSENTLVLLHVIFRHGDRTPSGKSELYPFDPHYNQTYFPTGIGQLTNKGKQKSYEVGKQLRRKYDQFLGPSIYPNLVNAISTSTDRTRASLHYCLAGLFPPQGEQIWTQDLPWQAIPIHVTERSKDRVLLGVEFPEYFKLYTEAKNSPKFQKEYAQFKDEFEYISKHAGSNISTFWDAYLLYFGILTEAEYGLKLPKWLDRVWPETITHLAMRQYSVATSSNEMNKLSTGYFLRKILDDTEEKIKETEKEFRKKMFLYCAHDSNMAMLLITLGIFDNVIPNYGSYVSFEVHRINGVYGFKIFYQNYDAEEASLMKLPGCDDFCPLDQFTQLYNKVLPEHK